MINKIHKNFPSRFIANTIVIIACLKNNIQLTTNNISDVRDILKQKQIISLNKKQQ